MEQVSAMFSIFENTLNIILPIVYIPVSFVLLVKPISIDQVKYLNFLHVFLIVSDMKIKYFYFRIQKNTYTNLQQEAKTGLIGSSK